MTLAVDIDLNPKELEEFYTRYFRYYTTLETPYKKVFIERALKFISVKMISGAADFEPDNRVKALVAASAVQLTLGLETWQLNYFEEIELHPSDFDNAAGNLKFSGETNLQGYIKLSWKSFVRGYEIQDDGVNLGLHEFSHALRFNSIKGNKQDYFIENYFNKWLACSNEAYNDLKNGRETIFRKYGGVNINEFLSVCIEHYFESPLEIKEKYPLLYYATGILLNQETSTTTTKVGVRKTFFTEQNKLLQGISNHRMESHFLKHWTFKLLAFVFAVFIYNISTSGLIHPITFALFGMLTAVFLWYDYNSVKIEFDKTQVNFEKGSWLFKSRKRWTISISQMISFRITSEEWIFTYYNGQDDFFHEEKICPPKGAFDGFVAACKQNKIAILH